MNKLKETRIKKGITQKQLAALSGISLRMIQHYEQGVKDLKRTSVNNALALAKALDCTIEDIIE